MCSLCRRCCSSDRSEQGLRSWVLPRIFLFPLLMLSQVKPSFQSSILGTRRMDIWNRAGSAGARTGEFYLQCACLLVSASLLERCRLGCAPVSWRKFGSAMKKTEAFALPISRLLCVLQTTSRSATGQSLWAPQSCCW